MKPIIRFSLITAVTLVLLSLTGCMGITTVEDGLVVGDTITIKSGETLDNDLTVIGGSAHMDEGSTLNGDFAIIGGNVTIDGTVNGDVSVIGGYLYLDDNARVRGNLSDFGATIRRSSSAVVQGQETEDEPFNIPAMRAPNMQVNIDPIGGPLLAIFQALAFGALAVLATLFAARQMDQVGRTALAQPVMTGGVGLLTLIVAPPLLLLLLITIILSPVSLLGMLALALAFLFGWLSLSLIVGRQVAVWLKQPWSDPVSAGAGAVVLSLVSSLVNIIPCIGWLASGLVWLVGLGAVLLTRFGTQAYPTAYSTPATYVPPVEPPGGARVYETPPEDRNL